MLLLPDLRSTPSEHELDRFTLPGVYNVTGFDALDERDKVTGRPQLA